VLRALAERHKLEPAGAPSLQNALEMARHAMGHLPAHASREVLVLTGALSTVDPGNIADTLDACVADKIRISVLALAAEMKICREMATRTGGPRRPLPPDAPDAHAPAGTFGVALNEGHYKDLLFALIPPPAQRALARAASAPADLLLMGFPARAPGAALCACHAEIRGAGFVCPRCRARVCDVPTDCDVCGLMLVSAPHLARSYHHLFPVHSYAAVCVPRPPPTRLRHLLMLGAGWRSRPAQRPRATRAAARSATPRRARRRRRRA
jgi:transcription initiation factor TFIIH subunit 2